MPAPRRVHVLEGVHAFRGHQRTPVPGMSWLPAALAPTLLSASAQTRFARQPVGRGRLRGCGRILLAQRELALQVRDLFRLLGQVPRLLSQLSIAFDQSLTQSLILTSQLVDVLSRAPFWHASHGTPIRRVVQDPLNCYPSLVLLSTSRTVAAKPV